MPYGNKPLILLVEADFSLQRLISIGLEHQGVQVITAHDLADLPPIAADLPDLLVLDIDCGVTSDWSRVASVRAHARLAQLPIITLSWERQQTQDASVAALCLSKPFDARNLYCAIDQLLVTGVTLTAEAEAAAEQALLAAYKPQAAPGLFPFLTAAGLLIAVIGMLLHVAIVVVGFLFVFVSLLLWTIGTRKHTSLRTIAVS